MLTFCYNTKQGALILLKIKIVGFYVNTTVEHYGNVFVHKGGKLEKRQFLAKMHQIAPGIVSLKRTLTPSAARGSRRRRRRRERSVGRWCPPPHRGIGLGRAHPRNFFRFWILNRRIFVQTECILYSSLKLV